MVLDRGVRKRLSQNGIMQIEGIFHPVLLQIIKLYINDNEYINNITGLAGELGMAHPTVRRHLTLLVSLGILKELDVGRGKVFMLNKNGPYTKDFISFYDRCKKIEEDKNDIHRV